MKRSMAREVVGNKEVGIGIESHDGRDDEGTWMMQEKTPTLQNSKARRAPEEVTAISTHGILGKELPTSLTVRVAPVKCGR